VGKASWTEGEQVGQKGSAQKGFKEELVYCKGKKILFPYSGIGTWLRSRKACKFI
jgi:hypothetical protein